MDIQLEKITKHPRFQETIQYLKLTTKSTSKVLEVGDNDASFKQYISLYDDWKTVDKFGSPDINVDLTNAELSLPIEDSSIDVVICTQVLEHLIQTKPFLDEVARILKPTGIIVISVPNMLGLKSRIFALLGIMPPMAASGDLGPEYGTHGAIVDGLVVGGHIIDYDLARLSFQLGRSGMLIKEQIGMPFTFRLFGKRINIHEKLIPKSLMDNIIVSAQVKNI